LRTYVDEGRFPTVDAAAQYLLDSAGAGVKGRKFDRKTKGISAPNVLVEVETRWRPLRRSCGHTANFDNRGKTAWYHLPSTSSAGLPILTPDSGHAGTVDYG